MAKWLQKVWQVRRRIYREQRGGARNVSGMKVMEFAREFQVGRVVSWKVQLVGRAGWAY